MGVKGLWQVLEPVKQHMSLANLRGQVIAVDLSIWIVEAKNVSPPSVTKPHLRNLFFRVSHLLQLGIVPVIVIEGVPPDLKQNVMRDRLRHQRRDRPNSKPPQKVGRKLFEKVQRECCEMLEMLGVPFMQAAAEAEAMCAFLNRHQIVNGCITNDGDAFLYGATTVYRNFTMNAKDRHVDLYSMDDVKATLGLNRESLVALALLLGCDYLPKGVSGVGREMAMRFIYSLMGESPLQRFYEWKAGQSPICTSGKNNESSICRRALESPGFPHKEVIDEFLIDKDRLPKQQRLAWKRPEMFQLVNYAFNRMEWPKEYTFSKILCLLTLFDMDAVIRSDLHTTQSLQPFRIVKTRIRNGVSCFEVEWYKIDGDTVTASKYYSTVEEQEIFRRAFPNIVATFELNRKSRPLERKTKGKKNKSVDDMSELIDHFQKLPMSDEAEKPVTEQSFSKILPKQQGTPSLEKFNEFGLDLKSSLGGIKSMTTTNGNQYKACERFVISSDSSDEDSYWADRSQPSSRFLEKTTRLEEASSSNVNTIPQTDTKSDVRLSDDSDSSLEPYLSLEQRLVLQEKKVIHQVAKTKPESKCASDYLKMPTNTSAFDKQRFSFPRDSGLDERSQFSSAPNDTSGSKDLEEGACISGYLVQVSDSLSSRSEKENEQIGGHNGQCSKTVQSDNPVLERASHSPQSTSELSCSHNQQLGITNRFSSKEKHFADRLAEQTSQETTIEGTHHKPSKSSDYGYSRENAKNQTAIYKNRNPFSSPLHTDSIMQTVCPWSASHYGNFNLETSILGNLNSSHNMAQEVSKCQYSCNLNESQIDLFDDTYYQARLENTDIATVDPATALDYTTPAVAKIPHLPEDKRKTDRNHQDSVPVSTCFATPPIASVSLAERLRKKLGDHAKVEILNHLFPSEQSSTKTGFSVD